jgi:hypothetical protein
MAEHIEQIKCTEGGSEWTPNLASTHIRIISTGCKTLATPTRRLVFFTWPLPIQDTSHATNSSASPHQTKGCLVHRFTTKLLTQHHAQATQYGHKTYVFKLTSRKIYDLIGKQELRDHRSHSSDFIRIRLLALDFVLAHPGLQYLESKKEKLKFFHEQLGTPASLLPGQTDSAEDLDPSLNRFFKDRFRLGSSGSNITCDVKGTNLDKVTALRLRNADMETDSNVIDGAVTISGDTTKGAVAFPQDKLCGLDASALKVYMVTPATAELTTSQVLHTDPRPSIQSVDPATIDPTKSDSTKVTVQGCHLDQVSEVQLMPESSSVATVKPALESGATPTKLSFTVKSSDYDLLAKSKAKDGEVVKIRVLVKPPLAGQVDTEKTITFKASSEKQTTSTSSADQGGGTSIQQSKGNNGVTPGPNSTAGKAKGAQRRQGSSGGQVSKKPQ